ncbi:MAG TPA: aminotransferase class IV [Microbacteriaceae bacterium]|nr:aminotransferase class IV [Microbacteriaceae bacterium]
MSESQKTTDLSPKQIMIAESFLLSVKNELHFVKGYEFHLARFRRSIKKILKESGQNFGAEQEQELFRFLESIPNTLTKAKTSAFPRLECHLHIDNDRLAAKPVILKYKILMRAAPPITPHLNIVAQQQNINEKVWAKGPNIGNYSKMQDIHGGEVLLTDSKGHLLETTTAAIVWWEDDTLFGVPQTTKRVTSITEKLVFEIATNLGFNTETKFATPKEVSTKPLWALNALHGIRSANLTYISSASFNQNQRLTNFRRSYNALEEILKQLD